MLVIFNLASCISLPSAVSCLQDLLLTAEIVSLLLRLLFFHLCHHGWLYNQQSAMINNNTFFYLNSFIPLCNSVLAT